MPCRTPLRRGFGRDGTRTYRNSNAPSITNDLGTTQPPISYLLTPISCYPLSTVPALSTPFTTLVSVPATRPSTNSTFFSP